MESTKLTLAERVQQENNKRYGYLSRFSGAYQSYESEELRQAAEKLSNLKYQTDNAIQTMFDTVAGKSPSPMRLLALPKVLARNDILGSSIVINILRQVEKQNNQDEILKIEDDVNETLEAIANCYNLVPTTVALAKTLSYEYDAGARNVVECYWLGKLSHYLSVSTPSFDNLLKAALESCPNYTDVLYTVERTPMMDVWTAQRMQLLAASSQQYQILENLLTRM